MAETPVSGLGPGYIFPGTILSVNTSTWLAEVAIDNVEAAVPDVTVAALYCHPLNGEGIFFLPEPDASCYIMFPSDGAKPFVLGYYMPIGDEENPPKTLGADLTESGGRPDINPGDIVLTTRDENFVILRRGGVVEIGATSLAQTLYIPMGNFIRSFFENYEASSPLGEFSWTHENKVSYNKGSKVRVKFKSKGKTSDDTSKDANNVAFDFEVFEGDDKMPKVYETTGFDKVKKSEVEAQDSASFLRLFVNTPTPKGPPDNKFALQVSQGGQVHFDAKGIMTTNVKGHEIYSLGSMRTEVAKMENDKAVTKYAREVSEDGKVTECAEGDIYIKSKGTITLEANLIVANGKNVRLAGNDGPLEPTISATQLHSWLKTAFGLCDKRSYMSPVLRAHLAAFPLKDTSNVKMKT